MSLKIDSDITRFKNIVRGKIKSDLKKFVSSEHMLGQQGSKTIRIPIDSIDLPRFTYGGAGGGAGSGDGDPGDPMPGQDQQGKGSGKAGNEKGEHDFTVEFTPEDLAKLLGEELELPDIADKAKGKIGSKASKYNTVRRVGPEGLRNFKRTYKEALKRSIATGNYNPADPVIIPIKDDKRYRASTPVPQPDVNAVIIYVMDISGSMQDQQRHIIKSEVYWTDLWLQHQYKGLVSRFIVHDTTAMEVDREQFFASSEAGGTSISSGYELAAHIIETEHPFSDWNSYVIHASDGDNWDSVDNTKAISIIRDRLVPNCNMFGYEQIFSENGSGQFYDEISTNFATEDKVLFHKTTSVDDVLGALKHFLGKGK